MESSPEMTSEHVRLVIRALMENKQVNGGMDHSTFVPWFVLRYVPQVSALDEETLVPFLGKYAEALQVKYLELFKFLMDKSILPNKAAERLEKVRAALNDDVE
mmetsp:Transcript_146829/g.208112  ORF Transcript_146829/g.208112 Transcript_146829/m.208112 type:complete len:103 (-) Transcript_146829:26-334(-)